MKQSSGLVGARRLVLANLSARQMDTLRQLQEKFGVVLVPLKEVEGIFVLEAKVEPNRWEPVHEVYPDIEGLASYYLSREDAALAKAALKSLLRRRAMQPRKLPIRIRKL